MDFDKERKFLQVKERLDGLRFSTVFPEECVQLLHKLVALVPSEQSTIEEDRKQQPSNLKDDSSKARAIGQQLQRCIKQNNRLHLEIIHFKQENQVLKKRIAKLESTWGTDGHHEVGKLKDQAAHELREELAALKKKYQELLHRAYNKENGFDNLDSQYKEQNLKREFNMAMPDQKFMELPPKQRKQANQQGQPQKQRGDSQETQDRLDLLAEKVRNREAEILRLQKKLEFDGVNMNKLLKDFEQQETRSRLESLNHQIDLLNKQNAKLKEELKKVKNNSSHAEVLRRDNQKQRTSNKADRSNFEKEIKKWEERQFQLTSALNKLKFDWSQQEKQLAYKNEQIEGLKKTVQNLAQSSEFQQKETKSAEQKLKVVERTNVNLQTGYEQMRNNVESEKIFLSYELEDVKKKFREAEFAVREYHSKNEALEAKLSKLEEINRISQEEEQLKSATLLNQEEIIQEQLRVIAELKIALEADRRKLQLQDRQSEPASHRQSIEEERHYKHRVDGSDDHQRNRPFEELSASYQVLNSQKSILQRDIRQVRLINEELQERLEKANLNYSKNVEELKQENDLLREDVRGLQAEADTLKATNIAVSKGKETSEFELRKLKSELQFLQSNLQEARSVESQHERIKIALKKAEGNIATQNLKLTALADEKNQLSRQVELAQAKFRSSRQAERKLKDTNSLLQEGVAELDNDKARLQSEYQLAAHRVAELEHSLNELVKQLKGRDQRILSLEDEAGRLRKEKTKLERKLDELLKQRQALEQRGLKQAEGSEKEEEILWLRRQLNNMVEKTDKYLDVNRELNELAALTKKQNEQLLQDQNGYKKEVEHLRLLCQDLELNIQKYKLNEQQLLQSIRELEIRYEQLGIRWDEQHSSAADPLKGRVQKVQQDFQKQMRESNDIMSSKK